MSDIRFPAGAVISFFGDSITAFDIYQRQVQTLLNAKEIHSCGVPGSTISGAGNDTFLARAGQLAPESELVFVFGGVNDFYYGLPLGLPDDEPSSASFCGSVRLLTQLVREQCPKAAVVFATPLQCTVEAENGHDGINLRGHTLEQYAEAILTVCRSEGVPVIDLYHDGSITAANAARYLSDGVHPNAEGMTVLAWDIAKGLKKLSIRPAF